MGCAIVCALRTSSAGPSDVIGALSDGLELRRHPRCCRCDLSTVTHCADSRRSRRALARFHPAHEQSGSRVAANAARVGRQNRVLYAQSPAIQRRHRGCVQGAPDARQRQLSLRRSRTRLPARQLRRRRSCCMRPSFAGRVAAIRAQLAEGEAVGRGRATVMPAPTTSSNTRHWPGVGDGAPLGIERSGDDMLFLYTGGTTGMPKGVMWRHDDLWRGTGAGGNPRIGVPPSPDLATYVERLRVEPPPVNLPLPPMMHGTGLLSAVSAMTHGWNVRDAAGAQLRRGRSAGGNRASSGQRPQRSSATRLPAPSWRRWTARKSNPTSRRCGSSALRASCGRAKSRRGCCATIRR